MSMIQWDPFKTLMRWPSIWDGEDYFTSSSTPSQLDVFETESDVVVRANVAGVNEKNIDITYQKGVLTITGEEAEESKEGKKYYQKATRSYSYRVAVPGNIDPKTEPKANIEKGVLEITFPKAEEVKPKKITVNVK